MILHLSLLQICLILCLCLGLLLCLCPSQSLLEVQVVVSQNWALGSLAPNLLSCDRHRLTSHLFVYSTKIVSVCVSDILELLSVSVSQIFESLSVSVSVSGPPDQLRHSELNKSPLLNSWVSQHQSCQAEFQPFTASCKDVPSTQNCPNLYIISSLQQYCLRSSHQIETFGPKNPSFPQTLPSFWMAVR